VAGLSGILVGPGDLSAAYGKPGQFTDPKLIDVAAGCIRYARAVGRHAGILVAPGPMLDAALDAGADLIFCGGDYGDLTKAWQALLSSLPAVPASKA
jgi:4-hydroxy-2-oxoheptanedioate aldolase